MLLNFDVTSSDVQFFSVGMFIFSTKKYRFCFVLSEMNEMNEYERARTVLSSPEVVLDMQRRGLACIDGRTSLMHLAQKSYYETDREIHYRFF